MLDEGLGVAKAYRNGAELQGIDKFRALLTAAFQLERDDAAEAVVHLLLGKLMTGMAFKARIQHALHHGMTFEEARNLHGVVTMLLHANIQGLHAAVDEECFERPEDCTCHILETEHIALVYELLGSDSHTRNYISVTVEILGGTVDDYIGAEVDGSLDIGGREGVVNDDLGVGAGGMRKRGDGFYVDELEAGVGGSLKIEGLGVGTDGCLYSINVLKVYKGDFDTVTGQPVGEECKGAAVEGIVRKQMIACVKHGPHDGGNRTHTASHGHACLRMLKSSELSGDFGCVGIAQTGVDIAFLFACETGGALRGGIKLKGRGLEDGGCERCDTRNLYLADMYLLRCEAAVLIHRILLNDDMYDWSLVFKLKFYYTIN